MKTAVVYARYSCDNQTEQSIEGQLRVCEQYAKNNDILILDTYIDRAMTGTNDNRPAFQKMLKDSKSKEWNYILVYKLDRFSRNKYEATIHKHTLANYGVKVLSAMENIPDTPEGIILESLLEGMNQYYSAELAQKVKRGMYESRIKGNFTGGVLPYGYKLDGKKIIIDEQKAEVVRYMYSQYAIGVSVTDIIKSLTNRGILNKNKPFVHNTVYKMLKNERYKGIYRLDGNVFDKLFPQIIDDELYEKVHKKVELNRFGTTSVKSFYLFRNKLTCGYCGMPISAESCRNRKHEKVNYYKCSGIKKHKNGCVKTTIRQDVLEKFLLDTIIDELKKPKNLALIVKQIMDLQNSNANNSFLEMLLKAKKQAENALDNVMQAIERGIINKTTNKRMNELEEQIEQLEKQIIVERSKTGVKINEKDITKYYTQALNNSALWIVSNLIKEIKLYNDKVEITFNNPYKKSPDDKGSSFLSIIKNLYIQHPRKNQLIAIKTQVDFYV